METEKKRFAAHVLCFDQQTNILKMIENCGPFVEKIYVAYSELPWTYNPNARDLYKNTTDPDILKESKYADKIELITGVWERDEEQRNACLKKAKEDGFDFLMIQDADEYYSLADYARMIEQISNNPDSSIFITPWSGFFKNWDYILEDYTGSTIIGYINVAINCKHDVWFDCSRMANIPQENAVRLDALCFHGTLVLTNEHCYRKINTWGHAHQFNREEWYREKWLNWTEQTEDLHPLHPWIYKRAKKYEGALPEVLQSH